MLAAADRHHLERVLRLRAGDELTVSDGAGGWRPCRFGTPLEPVGEVRQARRLEPLVTVGFTVVKGERPEWAVQKLTEIGVDRIVPLQSARSVVRWPVGDTSPQLARLRRVAREAAVQSRRVWLPVVDAVSPFEAVAAEPGAALAHPGGRVPSLRLPTVLVGPEGGWDDAEVASAPALVGLGPSVLRTETAAVVAGALLCALRVRIVAAAADSGA